MQKLHQLSLRFLQWFCHPNLLEDVEGDLWELHDRNTESKGATHANWMFAVEVLKLCRIGIIRPFGSSLRLTQFIMLKNNFKVAFRSLLKNRLYSFINILGLAIGLAAFLLISQYVAYEQSYEKHIPASADIYRVQLDVYQSGELIYKSSENYPGVGPSLLEEYPEVIKSAKLYNMGSKNNVIITSANGEANPKVLKHKKFLYAEGSILTIFNNEMIHGDAATALERPHTIVISESVAKKYFGEGDPMGKLLRLEDDDFNNELCEVTGVFKDVPQSTHLKYEVLISFPTLLTRGKAGATWPSRRYGTGWGRKDFYTYVQLRPGTDPVALAEKFPALVDKNKPDGQENREDILSLQPLTDIHLYSQLTDEAEVNGNGDGVFYLSVIAFFILIIAWVNYINLSTARSFDRGKEVGLRKVMGSYRSTLVGQFLVESFVINCLAMIAAFGLILLASPYFHNLGGTPMEYVIWNQAWFWGYVVFIILSGTLLSGSYPAFVLSSFKPVSVLHGKLKTSTSGIALRKSLVIFQFAMSVALIIGTSTVFKQMSYMQSQNLGYTMDQTMVIERPAKSDTSRTVQRNKELSFKNNLKQQTEISSVSGSSMLPGKKLRFKTPIRTALQTKESAVPLSIAGMDFDFAKAMNIEIVAGRGFSEAMKDELDSLVIITENASRALGFDKPEDAVGKRIRIERFQWSPSIVGVMADYHQENLKEEKPKTLFYLNETGSEYYMVKLNTQDLAHGISLVEEQWHSSFSGNPFHYFFLDEYFNSYYEAERQFKDLFSIFSVLAVIVGCLGLFGLASFTAIQRNKEIAIRKVLGSSLFNIVQLLSREFLVLIGIATLLVWPLSYFLMDEWLSNYPFRIEFEWTSFLYSGLVVLIVGAITISYQTIKSATANPVDALNHE